jgi:hypothetical protein
MVNRDSRDLLAASAANEVRYLVVGANAVTFHARPRFTNDLDLWVEPTHEHATRVVRALTEFGAPLAAHGVEARSFEQAGLGYKIGRPRALEDVRALEHGTP